MKNNFDLKPLKQYKLVLPDRLKKTSKEVMEYLFSEQYKDKILTAGACAFLLNIDKYDFQNSILPKYGINYMR